MVGNMMDSGVKANSMVSADTRMDIKLELDNGRMERGLNGWMNNNDTLIT